MNLDLVYKSLVAKIKDIYMASGGKSHAKYKDESQAVKDLVFQVEALKEILFAMVGAMASKGMTFTFDLKGAESFIDQLHKKPQSFDPPGAMWWAGTIPPEKPKLPYMSLPSLGSAKSLLNFLEQLEKKPEQVYSYDIEANKVPPVLPPGTLDDLAHGIIKKPEPGVKVVPLKSPPPAAKAIKKQQDGTLKEVKEASPLTKTIYHTLEVSKDPDKKA